MQKLKECQEGFKFRFSTDIFTNLLYMQTQSVSLTCWMRESDKFMLRIYIFSTLILFQNPTGCKVIMSIVRFGVTVNHSDSCVWCFQYHGCHDHSQPTFRIISRRGLNTFDNTADGIDSNMCRLHEVVKGPATNAIAVLIILQSSLTFLPSKLVLWTPQLAQLLPL